MRLALIALLLGFSSMADTPTSTTTVEPTIGGRCRTNFDCNPLEHCFLGHCRPKP